MSTFGENLKRIRKEKGLTQQEVAVGMGVSSVFISYYEKDTRKPKPETIRRFAAALHCSIDDLLKDTSLDEFNRTLEQPCEDCISRQAVKNEIRRWLGYLDEDMISRINVGIDRLPFVTPKAEIEEDVCKDCYYNDGDVHAECVVCNKAESEDKE